uniref:Protein FAR1-RELATED SEQUENCE n=1 Tax=Lactuca sativa TaxID=4236 RepID=A0A9R1W4Z8_LACSA|nr:hypothetical protein LSAT_V11C300134510 [Lactuca sativa]
MNRADAIRVSIENVFPHTHHGVCAFHLLGNIVHQFEKNDKTKFLFWRRVRAYKRNVFEDLWYRFSSTTLQVTSYLSEIPHEWCNKRHIDGCMTLICTLIMWNNKLMIYNFFTGKRSTVLTKWAEKVVSKNEERTTGWSVSGVSDAIYQVYDFKHGGITDLRKETSTYKMEMYRSTFEEVVYPLPEPCDWDSPTEMMVVKPPIMDTRQAGRQNNKNCIPLRGKEPIVRRCSRYDSIKHNATTCPILETFQACILPWECPF